ncbi:MAG TPA: sigma-70 family RNA polymerase sigma factor [Verrucomicrobiae bacterium]|nr:sigma-70 family RNA polymerase sigma factor [Verrucomicrobiae bacterium]
MLDRQTAEESQAELLRRIAAQDQQALAEFYDQTAGLLYSTALRILGDPHETDEVIQDVFVQIWNKAAMFDARLGAPLHWTLGITRNRCIDRLRARQRRSCLLEDLVEASAIESVPSMPPGRMGLSVDELTAVRSAVKGLPYEQRQAIAMAFFRGMTHREIAKALNEPLGTTKARIRRGMVKLRESLQAYV